MSAKKSNRRRRKRPSVRKARGAVVDRTNASPDEAHDSTAQANLSKLEFVVFNRYGFHPVSKEEAAKILGRAVEELK